ncbi:hypothetical protein [Nocardia sp. NPDC051463]|uniref:hypothetical protein n=1 Tax=Nocardia sp. NPDC051463 TaxID=3154845 RepID=UPI00343528E8
MAEQGLVLRPAARERFARAEFGAFAAVTYPQADAAGVVEWLGEVFAPQRRCSTTPADENQAEREELVAALAERVRRAHRARRSRPAAHWSRFAPVSHRSAAAARVGRRLFPRRFLDRPGSTGWEQL